MVQRVRLERLTREHPPRQTHLGKSHAGATGRLYCARHRVRTEALAVGGGIYHLVCEAGGRHSTDLKVQLVPVDAGSALTSTSTVNARYYVTVDGNSNEVASSLPRDANGRAYIDASTAGQAGEIQLMRSVGTELRTGQHHLSIRVDTTESGASSDSGAAGMAAPVPQNQATDLPGIGAITVEAN